MKDMLAKLTELENKQYENDGLRKSQQEASQLDIKHLKTELETLRAKYDRVKDTLNKVM